MRSTVADTRGAGKSGVSAIGGYAAEAYENALGRRRLISSRNLPHDVRSHSEAVLNRHRLFTTGVPGPSETIPFDTTRTNSTSKMTVLSVSPSPLAILVGLNMVVYSRRRSEKSRGIGS